MSGTLYCYASNKVSASVPVWLLVLLVAKGPLGTVTAEANGALDNDCWVEVHSRTFTAPLSCMHTQSRRLVCIGTSHVHTGSALADDWL